MRAGTGPSRTSARASNSRRALTAGDVARFLRVGREHVYRLVAQGLPARRVGRAWHFEAAKVVAWARSAGREGPRAPDHGRRASVPERTIRSGRSLCLLKVVGPSGSGKTSLAESLIRRWKAQGRRVGYLKHASHGFDLDRPGKDSHRAAKAGAAGVALVSPTAVALIERTTIREPEGLVERFFNGYDVVLIEGFRLADVPTILFLDADGHFARKSRRPDQVFARVWPDARGAASDRSGVPAFERDDVRGIAAAVEARLGMTPSRPTPASAARPALGARRNR